MKLTQRDLLVLHLATLESVWQPAFALKGFQTALGWVGSESDRRLYEIMETVRQRDFYEVKGARYVLEERRNGKYKEYRVASSKPKPRSHVELVDQPDGSRIAIETMV